MLRHLELENWYFNTFPKVKGDMYLIVEPGEIYFTPCPSHDEDHIQVNHGELAMLVDAQFCSVEAYNGMRQLLRISFLYNEQVYYEFLESNQDFHDLMYKGLIPLNDVVK